MSKLFKHYTEDEVEGIINLLNSVNGADEEDEDFRVHDPVTLDHLKNNESMANDLYEELRQWGCQADDTARDEMANGWLEELYEYVDN